MRLPILYKILVSFLCLSIIPLLLAGYVAIKSVRDLGQAALQNTEKMGVSILAQSEAAGDAITEESIVRLDRKSTEAIEVRTLDLADRIAEFLYSIDGLSRILIDIPRNPAEYLKFYQSCRRRIAIPPTYTWDSSEGQWVPESPPHPLSERTWKHEANRKEWNYNPPRQTQWTNIPLFREITFFDTNGQEQIKIRDGLAVDDLRDISNPANTFCKTEDYFEHARGLEAGELYVSPVVSKYEPFWGGTPGIFNPEEHPGKDPGDYAYAGLENPSGRRAQGLVRWVLPVYNGRQCIGYVSAALDQRHIQEMVDHIHPTPRRFTEHPDGGSGNYAFIWDNNHRSIAHPRHFFMCGYDAQTGQPVPGWTSSTRTEQLEAGRIPLDGRVLDFAPQCQGWANITEEGGSGSFQISWSGLEKLTTVAAIPYHTGSNYASPRGFGYVTIGSNVEDFHKDAIITEQRIAELVANQQRVMGEALERNRELIYDISSGNIRVLTILTLLSALIVLCVAILISLGITRPLKKLRNAAVAMGAGNLDQHVNVTSNDEMRELADTFNKMVDNLQAVDRMKSEFVSVASHELRTPIHAMHFGVSAVLDGYCGHVSNDIRKEMNVVGEGIKRLTRLVDDLLDVARMEAGRSEIAIEQIQLRDVAETAIREVEDLAVQKNHELVTRFHTAGNLYGDKDRLTQALLNLIGNSIKYTPSPGHILIELAENDDEIRLSVADDGYGIPPEVHDKVFEKFFQADSLHSHQVGGTGLGLPITKGIIEAHGGQLTIESPLKPGQVMELQIDGQNRKGVRFTAILRKTK